MNEQPQTTSKAKRPRICKGVLVTSTNQARVACMKEYITVYIFRPFSYKVIKKLIVNLPLIN